MSVLIHPSAIVSPDAKLGENVRIGANSIVEGDVEIGDGTEIAYSAVIADGARIGNNCRIFSHATIATEPQDIKYKGEKTFAFVGDGTVVREFATINRATTETYKTIVGKNCLVMTYSHVAHDCRVGDNVRLTNVVQLAGHVVVEDNAILGGSAIIHQFCKIGKNAMIGGGVKIVKDVPPYAMVGENPPKIDGLNKIGLRRNGFSNEAIKQIDDFYKILLHSGLNTSDGLAKYKSEYPTIIPEVQHCIDFIESSNRGIYR
jgi:UDP-N-acetylglucosamine acyltransferase